MKKKQSLQSLRVSNFNINYISNKIDELKLHLHKHKDDPFHIFGICESHHSTSTEDESESPAELEIPNYKLYHRVASKPGHTGKIVYIHESIANITKRRKDLESELVECIWLEVKPSNRRPFLVASIYRNPASTFDWYDYFVEMADRVGFTCNDILCLGDFNIDMLKNVSSWKCTMEMLGIKQFVEKPTRVTSTTSTIIDHIYSNCPELISDVSVDENLSLSDHFPVTCRLALEVKLGKKEHSTITYRSFKNFNQSQFLNDLSQAPFHLILNETDPDFSVELWHDIFMSVLNRHAPTRSRRVKKVSFPPWLTPEIRKAMEQRNLFKKMKLFDDFKKQRNVVKSLIRKSKKEYFSRLVAGRADTASIWRALAMITNGRQSQSNKIPPNISAEDFNNHFASIANQILPVNKTCNYAPSQELLNFCSKNIPDTSHFDIPLLAVHEVGKLISQMTNKKSSGLDDISPKILKLALPYIVESLTYVFNLCLKENTFPKKLKEAKVIPLPKTKNPSDISSFRPISILSAISKPLEKHIHSHTLEYLEKYELLHKYQSGFRPKHSCHTALARLVDKWLINIRDRELSGVIFLDFSKAFDLINHEIMLEKLNHYFPNSNVIELFRSYLSDRYQQVLVNGKLSSPNVLKNGVPQGSILGPLFFSLYINDLPLQLQSIGIEGDFFADDGTLNAKDKTVEGLESVLEKGLVSTSKWCHNNCMVLNLEKTKSAVIATRQKHQKKPLILDLKLNKISIQQVNKHRLLGVTISNQLSWQAHIDETCKKISRNLYTLSKLRYLTCQNTRKIFYDANIKSHLDYASTIWDGAEDVHLKKLNSLQRRAAKLIDTNPLINTDQKLSSLGILPLLNHLQYNKSVFMYKLYYDLLPSYINDMIPKKENTRYATSKLNVEVLPKPRLDIVKTSLSFSGSELWNSLPPSIQSAPSLSIFKRQVIQYLNNNPRNFAL